MDKKVLIQKTVLNNKNFQHTVDTSFKYFSDPIPPADPDTVNELFRLYNKLFFSIPVTGLNSHQEIVTRSSELYTAPADNTVIQPLLDEVAELRTRLLQANQEILSLSQQING